MEHHSQSKPFRVLESVKVQFAQIQGSLIFQGDRRRGYHQAWEIRMRIRVRQFSFHAAVSTTGPHGVGGFHVALPLRSNENSHSNSHLKLRSNARMHCEQLKDRL